MIQIPLHAPLRDGRSCVIRRAGIDDAAGLLEIERAISRARRGVVKHEDELPSDAAAYADRLREHLTSTDGSALVLVAELEGSGIVGEASIRRFTPRMIRHVGIASLGIHPSAQGVGLGRTLFEMLLEWARSHRDADGGRVLRVELYVRADNPRAIALYGSLGFVLEGTRRSFIREDDGAFVDDFVMGLLFK
jgi:putative acetyltransferase